MIDQNDDLQFTMDSLDLLQPQTKPLPPSAALTQFKARQQANHTTQRSLPMTKRKPAIFGLMAMLAVIILFSFPAARAAAGNLLGIFRVQQFAPISISPEQLATLEKLGEEGFYPGEMILENEFTEPVSYQSITTAAKALRQSNPEHSSFLRVPTELGSPDRIMLLPGNKGTLTINLEGARSILEAANIDPLLLPDSVDGQALTVSLFDGIEMSWGQDTIFIQSPSPEINYPDDVDPAIIGEAMLRFLGMSDNEAYRLSRSIDWTNTLVLPIPTEIATFAEVRLDDGNGFMMEAVDSSGNNALIWQSHGVIYMLGSESMDSESLIETANSLDYRLE